MQMLSLLADHSDRLVGRKIVAVIFENEEIQRRNQAVGSIARSYINLAIFQCGREQAQIHNAGWGGKVQTIGRGQSSIAIGTLHELVAESRSPLRSETSRLR